MITTIIVFASLAFAAAFLVAWIVRPELRNQIERPKHDFQDQLRRYDRRCGTEPGSVGVDSDEPRQ